MENNIREQVLRMGEQELQDLNYLVCAQLTHIRDSANLAAAAKFKTGDKVSFESKKRGYAGKVIIIIDKITGKSIHGHELKNFGMQWSVSPSLCKSEI